MLRQLAGLERLPSEVPAVETQIRVDDVERGGCDGWKAYKEGLQSEAGLADKRGADRAHHSRGPAPAAPLPRQSQDGSMQSDNSDQA